MSTVIDKPPPPNVPGYEILERLGVGAVGEVWKAWQPTLKRFVAIKFMRRDALMDQSAVQRFRQEAKAIAQMHRADIVQIYDVCIPSDGQPPYLVLEYVDGGTLAQKINGVAWQPRDAAAFIEEIARAMHVVHRRGIVHRDLKPANILLASPAPPPADGPVSTLPSTRGSLPQMKITDFGLAKRFDRLQGVMSHERTQTGVILGTPNYMAPEQARGETSKIGPPADVHALGAILYELLTGRPPFRAANHLDTLLMVIHTEPVPVRELQANVPRDLQSICLKCLCKDPERRYTSAGALAEDLRRFQVGEPVQANPVSSLDRAFRWGRRHLLAMALVSSVLMVLLTGIVATTLWARAAQAEAARAQEAATAAEQQHQRAEEQRKAAEQQAALLQAQLSAAQLARVALLWDRDPQQAQALLDDKDIFPPDQRDAAWRFYDNLCQRQAAVLWWAAWAPPISAALQTIHAHDKGILTLALSWNGKTLASGGADRTIKLWNLQDGSEQAALAGQTGPVTALAFCEHTRILATCAGDAVVKRWEEPTGKPGAPLAQDGKGVVAVVVAASGSWLAVGHQDGSLVLWDAGNDQLTRTLAAPGQTVTALAFSPDGKFLASAGADKKVRLWNVESGEEQVPGPQGTAAVLALAFSPDGKLLAFGGESKTIHLWQVQGPKELAVLRGHTQEVRALVFSVDGKTLASGSADGTIRLWEVSSGQERAAIKGHPGGVSAVLFGANGRTLISAGHDGTIKLWDVGGR